MASLLKVVGITKDDFRRSRAPIGGSAVLVLLEAQCVAGGT